MTDIKKSLKDPLLGSVFRNIAIIKTHEQMANAAMDILEQSVEITGEVLIKSCLVTIDVKPCEGCKGFHPKISILTTNDDKETDSQLFLARILEIINTSKHPEGH